MRVLRREGFSLTELLVAGGVASSLALIMGQMMTNQFTATRSLELRSAARDLVEDMMGILNNRYHCVASLGGKDPNSDTATQILVDPDSNSSTPNNVLRYTTVSPGNQIGPLKIQLTGISLKTDPTNGVPTIPANTTGTALLTLSFSLGSQVLGSATFEAVRRISVVTNAATRISSCSTTLMDKQMAQFFCSTLGGAWDATGRGGLGDCKDLKISGTLEVSGQTVLKSNVTVENGSIEIR